MGKATYITVVLVFITLAAAAMFKIAGIVPAVAVFLGGIAEAFAFTRRPARG